MRRQTIKKKRLYFIQVATAAGFVLATLSQAKVQIIDRKAILDQASETDRFVVTRIDYARRGAIYSSDGKPLAQDEDTRVLTVEFHKIPKSPAFFMDLGAATGLPPSEFALLANSGLKSREWRKPMSSSQAREVQRVKTFWRADGVSLSRSGRRNYPLGEAAAGFIGSMRDGVALGGLELGQSKLLAGENGRISGLVDGGGSWLPMRLDPNTISREDGQDLTLTIDSELQFAATSALKQAVDSNKADQGVAIVMDPRTGDILAMANWPSFDPNNIGAPQKPDARTTDFNPNYMATLEPGSTFKILTLAKAIDAGHVSPNERFFCRGTMEVHRRVMGCAVHNGTRAHGDLSPELAIAKSCNVAAANWALRVGYTDFVKFIEDVGLLEKTNLGVPGQRPGLFNYNEFAKQLQLATVGFGQSVNTTPVGLASAFSTLANDGRRVPPRLIKKVGERDLAVPEGAEVITPETAHLLLEYMEAVVETDAGTGKSLRIPGYRLSGKTGTAQKVNRTNGGGYVSNFVGYVPAHEPRAVILVMVDNPKMGKYYGGAVAGPVFVQIAKATIRRLGIPPSNESAKSHNEKRRAIAAAKAAEEAARAAEENGENGVHQQP